MTPGSVPPPGGGLELVVDTTSPAPVCDQLQEQIRSRVRLGHLPAGTALPPIRRLAGHLGVSNGVVARAYRALEEEGLLRTAGRRGTTVAAEPTPADVDSARRAGLARAAADYAASARALGVTPDEAVAAAREALAAVPLS